MHSEHIFDALIIGGGPAGATTALLLAQAGWSVALVEKQNFPRRKVCGEFISATSFPLMQKLGIADFYLANCGPEVQRVGLFAADTILTTAMPKAADPLGKWGRSLERWHLDQLLLNEAKHAGATIWQPWHASHLQNNSAHFTCYVTSKEETAAISARIIILAHGSWERGLIQECTSSHKKTDFLAFKAHFNNADLADDLMPLLVFPGGYGGLVKNNNNQITLSCCIRRDVLQQIRIKNPGVIAGDVVLHHITSTCLGAQRVLSHANRDGAWLAAGPIRPGIRSRYNNGCFFVGNIAGEAHPIIAEGISMAMQSAWVLSQTLISNQHTIRKRQNLTAIGLEYSHQWNAHFANRIRASFVFAQLAIRPQVVSMLLPLLRYFPSILAYGAKLSGKIQTLRTLD